MTRNLWKVLLAASGLACFFAFSASAETVPFTTEDGVLSMELSDESWKDVDDQDTWVTLTNGSDVITLFHIRNGEKLPDPAVADDPYSDVYQAWLSSKDEVFVLTGSVRNSSDLDQVEAAIESAEILKKGTKKAVSQNQTGFAASSAPSASSEADTSAGSHAGSGAITEIDVTYYVKSSALNVRASDDSSAAVIGQLSYGDAVKITGYTDNHWYRISYRGATGFVYADYVTETKPGTTPETAAPSNPAPDFSSVTALELYYENGNTVHITKNADGSWADDSGLTYNCTSEDGAVWTNSEGSRLTTYAPWATGEIKH